VNQTIVRKAVTSEVPKTTKDKGSQTPFGVVQDKRNQAGGDKLKPLVFELGFVPECYCVQISSFGRTALDLNR
jgi:hypothetical protein